MRDLQRRALEEAGLRTKPRALAGAVTKPYWLEHPASPAALPPLDGTEQADMAVIGGGFSGL